MKHIGKIAGLALSAVMALTMTAPAFASDYSFTTTALQDYYNSTSYEDVYGSQYNYGGRNVVDYDIPELEYGRMSTTMTGVMERTILPGLQQVVASTDGSGYGLGGENGGGGGPLTELVLDDGTGAGSGSTVPVIPDTPQITVPNSPAYTSVQGMSRMSCCNRHNPECTAREPRGDNTATLSHVECCRRSNFLFVENGRKPF